MNRKHFVNFSNYKILRFVTLLLILVVSMQNCSRVSVVDGQKPVQQETLSSNAVEIPSALDGAVNFVLVGNAAVMNGVSAERVIPKGTSVYVRWSLVLKTPTAVKVKVSFSLDGITKMTVAENLIDGQNGCEINGPGSADDSATGCFLWQNGSPASSHYRVQLTFTGVNGAFLQAESLPINGSGIQLIAGATTNGLGGPVSNSILVNEIVSAPSQIDGHSLVASTAGEIYFRDVNMGIVTFSTQNQTLRSLVPNGATNSGQGDGGHVTQAALRAPFAMTLDHQQGLLIFDYDRIRRVNLAANPPTISTVIGGGSLTDDVVTNPLDLKIQVPPTASLNTLHHQVILRVLPNGDIYFYSEKYNVFSYKRIRVYRAATGKIESIYANGVANFLDFTTPVDQCGLANLDLGYDPVTKELHTFFVTASTNTQCEAATNVWRYQSYQIHPTTGAYIKLIPNFMGPNTPQGAQNVTAMSLEAKDGQIYRMDRFSALLKKWDTVGSKWVPVLGSGVVGSCPDGTAALNCNVDFSGGYVDANGKIYFVDRGRIRTVRNGLVQTIGGQGFNFGDGGPALYARFGHLTGVQVRADGGLIVLDSLENRFRLLYRGGLIMTVAGNGGRLAPDFVNPATSQSFNTGGASDIFTNFLVDEQTNNISYPITGQPGLLNMETGLWQTLAGKGNILYSEAADGTAGNQLRFQATNMQPFAENGQEVLYGIYQNQNGVVKNVMLASFSKSNGAIKKITGPTTGAAPSICADGTSLATCRLPLMTRSSMLVVGAYDAVSESWLLLDSDQKSLRQINPQNGSISTVTQFTNAAQAFVFRRFNNKRYVFYCSKSGDMYRKNIETGNETVLPWTVESLKCSGSQFVYVANNHSLVFIFQRLGLEGVAEIFSIDPPASE